MSEKMIDEYRAARNALLSATAERNDALDAWLAARRYAEAMKARAMECGTSNAARHLWDTVLPAGASATGESRWWLFRIAVGDTEAEAFAAQQEERLAMREFQEAEEVYQAAAAAWRSADWEHDIAWSRLYDAVGRDAAVAVASPFRLARPVTVGNRCLYTPVPSAAA